MLTFFSTRSLWTCESRVLMLISMVDSGSSAGFTVELLAPWEASSAILHRRKTMNTRIRRHRPPYRQPKCLCVYGQALVPFSRLLVPSPSTSTWSQHGRVDSRRLSGCPAAENAKPNSTEGTQWRGGEIWIRPPSPGTQWGTAPGTPKSLRQPPARAS